MNCPHFDNCNAPLCPLTATFRQSIYLDGEPVCSYMLEIVKPFGRLNLMGAIGGNAIYRIADAVEWAFLAHGPMRKRLQRASRTPSRMAGGGQ